jgi:hypothetical protein
VEEKRLSSNGFVSLFSLFFTYLHDNSTGYDRISLELLADGSPKTPEESRNDDLPKLYVHHGSFMKVLGATVDIDLENITPIMHDREGNLMDPNA